MNIMMRQRQGFTLIEMILAIGVSAIVLIAVNAVLFGALRLREATSNMVDAANPLDQTMAFLRRDIQGAMTPTNSSNSKVLSGDFRVGSLTSPGVPEMAAIEMYTSTGALSANAPWADIQRVTYELRQPAGGGNAGRDLIRSVVRNLLTISVPEVEDQVMMSGLADIKFTCYDGMQWQDVWDTTSQNSSNTNLPVAVRVELTMFGNNKLAPIVTVVPIDSQARTNMVLTASGS